MTDIGVTLAQLQKRIDRLERASRLSYASLDDTALEVRDAGGSLRGIVGQQGDGTTAVNIVNGGPPPSPATPSAAPALGGVSVGWDGTFANGAVIPMDWARVEVHASSTAAFDLTADTLKATIETAQGGIVYIPSAVPLYVALLARNTSGAASPATAVVGPYAPKPVAGEIGIGEITETLIADGSVTTPKVFANAVTTAKLAAGSVDAVALKADAITGKTITGGVINGAEFHSDNGSGGLVDIADGTVVATAQNAWKIIIDPGNEFPAIGFLDDAGTEMAAMNATGVSGRAGLNISSGPLTDGTINDWRWVTTMRDSGVAVGGFWQAARVRDSNSSASAGALVNLNSDRAQIGYHDTTTTAHTMLHLVHSLKLGQFDDARVEVLPPVSNSPALYLGAKTGHTGNLVRAQVNSVDRFVVTAAGAVTAASSVSAASATFTGAVNAASAALTGDLTIAGTSQDRGYVAFQARSSATADSGTEQIALTQTGVVIKNGRAYRLRVRGLAVNKTANTGVRIRIRRTNISGAIWLDTFTITTPNANANYQYNNETIVINDTGADITSTFVMTWVSVSAGNSFLNTGNGIYTTMEILDAGSAADFSTAQSAT